MKTIKKLCTPRQSVFDPSRRDTVLSLNSLAKKPVSPDAFFAENHMTQGMRVLLTEGFKRLEGRSDQGVFRLTQAMGGGKTHNLIAFGLLAQHPEHRAPVMGGFHTPAPGLGKARVITFSGRESDSPYGIWGAIAQQVGRLEFFQQYYSPLSAPGETAWANLLKGEPTVVMLDELPPYFEYARSKPIGDSNLAVVTGTALANLLVAVTEELPQCCVIITDLKASYEGGTQQLSAALRNLDQETDRVALDLEPVRLASDEFLPHPAQAHLRDPTLRRRGGRGRPGLREGPARGPADGRDQRLPRAVRSPGRSVLPLPPVHPRSLRPVQGEPGLPANPRVDPAEVLPMTAKHVPSEALKLTPAEHRLQACREGKLDGFPSEDVFRDGRS